MSRQQRETRRMIQRALEAVSGGIERLAQEMGVHYNTVWSWKEGRRSPSPESRRKLVEALRRRSSELGELADELEESTREEGE